jgi:hypothetical protein
MRGCVPTNVCGDETKEYNYKGKDLAGKVMCGTDKKPKKSSSKPETVIPKTLKVLGAAGNRCKDPTKVITEKTDAALKTALGKTVLTSADNYANKYYWGKKAEDCSTRALEL